MRHLFLWEWCSFPPIWVIEEARKVSFPAGVALYSLQLLFPLQPDLCRRKLRRAVGYFKWLFCASLLSVSKRAKALQLACMGGDLGQDCSSAGETWPDSVEEWLPGLFVWNLFFPPQAHDLCSQASGAPKRVPPQWWSTSLCNDPCWVNAFEDMFIQLRVHDWRISHCLDHGGRGQLCLSLRIYIGRKVLI